MTSKNETKKVFNEKVCALFGTSRMTDSMVFKGKIIVFESKVCMVNRIEGKKRLITVDYTIYDPNRTDDPNKGSAFISKYADFMDEGNFIDLDIKPKTVKVTQDSLDWHFEHLWETL